LPWVCLLFGYLPVEVKCSRGAFGVVYFELKTNAWTHVC
jgi:hypothetical protein